MGLSKVDSSKSHNLYGGKKGRVDMFLKKKNFSFMRLLRTIQRLGRMARWRWREPKRRIIDFTSSVKAMERTLRIQQQYDIGSGKHHLTLVHKEVEEEVDKVGSAPFEEEKNSNQATEPFTKVPVRAE